MINIFTKVEMSIAHACPLCSRICEKKDNKIGSSCYTYICKYCGKFTLIGIIGDNYDIIKEKWCNMIFEYLIRKPKDNKGSLIEYCFFYDKEKIGQTQQENYKNVAELMSKYPKDNNEKFDRILLNLDLKFPLNGEKIPFFLLPHSFLYCESDDYDREKKWFEKNLKEIGYIGKYGLGIHLNNFDQNVEVAEYQLTFKAWKKIDELKNKQHYTDQNFRDSCNETQQSQIVGLSNCNNVYNRNIIIIDESDKSTKNEINNSKIKNSNIGSGKQENKKETKVSFEVNVNTESKKTEPKKKNWLSKIFCRRK